jgi:hypothetical protein
MVELEPPTSAPSAEVPVKGPVKASEEVAAWYRAPAFAPTSPESAPSTGVFVKVWVPAQVLEVVVPNAVEMVFALLTSGYVKVSASCFPLNVDQSAEERRPRFEAEAVGRLKVSVLPLPVTVKSVPVVEEAMVIVEPVCVWPRGPIAVIALVRYVLVSMESVPSPPLVLTNPLEVRFESFVMFWVVFTLNAPAE